MMSARAPPATLAVSAASSSSSSSRLSVFISRSRVMVESAMPGSGQLSATALPVVLILSGADQGASVFGDCCAHARALGQGAPLAGEIAPPLGHDPLARAGFANAGSLGLARRPRDRDRTRQPAELHAVKPEPAAGAGHQHA